MSFSKNVIYFKLQCKNVNKFFNLMIEIVCDLLKYNNYESKNNDDVKFYDCLFEYRWIKRAWTQNTVAEKDRRHPNETYTQKTRLCSSFKTTRVRLHTITIYHHFFTHGKNYNKTQFYTRKWQQFQRIKLWLWKKWTNPQMIDSTASI